MSHLTVAYITGREIPQLEWFFRSIANQLILEDHLSIVIVSPNEEVIPFHKSLHSVYAEAVKPKPTVWQGPHRLTKSDYWAVSNSRNTAICYAPDGWIAFLDDRCVLMPGWLQAVRNAMAGNYAVCGTYKKVHGLKVSQGQPIGWDKLDGEDHRLLHSKGGPCSGQWFFGCSCALPIEWALQVNGYDECCDGLGAEDYIFGLMLEKQRFPIRFDPTMAVIQDRTPGECGPTYKKTDKGVSPSDKSHAILNMVQTGGRHVAPNFFPEGGLRALRAKILAGEPFPISQTPQNDWYDGQLISEFQ